MAWPFDSEEQLDEWVEAYIVAHRERATTTEQQDDALLASEPAYLFPGTESHAGTVWRFILKVIAKRPSEWTLGMLAAGPIEDLIGVCGDDFIDRIEAEARRDPLFRRTLHGVWQTTSRQEVWDRVVRARGPDEDR